MNEKVAAAIVAAQAELRTIAKDSTNPHFKNTYASLDTIIEQVRPILARHHLAVMQGGEAADGGAALVVTTLLVHDSGEFMSTRVYVPIVKRDPQGAGGALTYGRRYGLSAALCLATDEDDDGNSASKAPTARRAERSPVRPAASTERVESSALATQGSALTDEDRRMAGKRLGDHTNDELKKIIERKKDDASWRTLVEACRRILTNRALGETDDARVARAKAAVVAEDSDLPF